MRPETAALDDNAVEVLDLIERDSDNCLKRVCTAERLLCRMITMLHELDNDHIDRKLIGAELDQLLSREPDLKTIVEKYVGLPIESLGRTGRTLLRRVSAFQPGSCDEIPELRWSEYWACSDPTMPPICRSSLEERSEYPSLQPCIKLTSTLTRASIFCL